jgi:hypothetical protein
MAVDASEREDRDRGMEADGSMKPPENLHRPQNLKLRTKPSTNPLDVKPTALALMEITKNI